MSDEKTDSVELSTGETLDFILKQLKSRGLPRVHERVSSTTRNRATRLFNLALDPEALTAIEEVLTWFGEAEELAASETSHGATILIRRVRLDLEVAFDALLDGVHSTLADAMRDVMEVEFLFRDFGADTGRLKRWRSASRRERLDQYGPAKVRKRVARHIYPDIKSPRLPDEDEYTAHSEVTHPTPDAKGTTMKEVSDEAAVQANWLFEWMEHARRASDAIAEMIDAFGIDRDRLPDPEKALRSAITFRARMLETFHAALDESGVALPARDVASGTRPTSSP